MRKITYAEAVREALVEAMERDESVCVIGQGVSGPGGVYGTTSGLKERFGAGRVVESPLSEEGMAGVAVGMAMAGLRPVVTHIRADFLMLCANQLVNVAAKARWMWGGQVKVPLVVRAIIGKSWGQGAQHSQGLYPLFCHIPGLEVCAPTTPADAKRCLSASLRGDGPVMFFEHRLLHYERGDAEGAEKDCPRSAVKRRSGEDITLVGVSWAVRECLKAAELLEPAGVSAEVIDPVWLRPLDLATVAASFRRTRRLLAVENCWTFCGLGAEIAAEMMESGLRISGRFARMGFAPVACPPSKPLEDDFYPDAAKIAAKAYLMATGERRDFSVRKEKTPIARTTRSF
jgi:pyruvate/2-oxoglutarate/acetoin dehydrogenase E1 component